MKKADKVALILETLQAYYPNPPVPLDHRDPYTLLIAVLLSAQCTDQRVNTVTPALFEAANTPAQMVQMQVEDIQAIIRPCGLSPAKSKNIHRLSELLYEIIKARYLKIWKRWKPFLEWVTKQLPSLWRSHSVFPRFPWTPTSID